MKTLTKTTHISTFTFPPPEVGSISLDDPSKSDLTIPVGSPWTSGRHWHDHHAEHWKVLSGAMLITLNNDSFIVTRESPTVSIPPKVRHELMRWDCPGRTHHQNAAQEAFRKEMLVNGQSKELEKLGATAVKAEESTTPADGEKQIFFRNLLSAISEPRTSTLGGILKFAQILIIYHHLDARMVMVDMGAENASGWRAMIEEGIWWLYVRMASLIGAVFDLQPVSEAYTPGPLVSEWEKKKPK